jgi:hypothetical protein
MKGAMTDFSIAPGVVLSGKMMSAKQRELGHGLRRTRRKDVGRGSSQERSLVETLGAGLSVDDAASGDGRAEVLRWGEGGELAIPSTHLVRVELLKRATLKTEYLW